MHIEILICIDFKILCHGCVLVYLSLSLIDESAPGFLPEPSALYKLQEFVKHYVIEENRYLASPYLMYFDTNQLIDDDKIDCDNLTTCNEAEYTSGSDDDEFIDVETIQPNSNSTCRTQVMKP